jgi:hypothetical protein
MRVKTKEGVSPRGVSPERDYSSAVHAHATT